MYYVYMISCEKNKIYTGIAKDIEKRFKAHIEGKGAKFTKAFKPIKIEKIIVCKDRREAQIIEFKIKKMNRKQKEDIILNKKEIKF